MNSIPGPSSDTAAVWGSVTGTLSAQTDLQNALNAKAALVSPSFTTPTLGVASGTSLALGGATIGAHALAVTGTGLFNGAVTHAVNGAASTPPLLLSGTIFTGGSATTTKPALLIEPAGTATTNWSTGGTLYGGNAASGFAGRLADLQVAAVSKFRVSASGAVFSPDGYFLESVLGSGNRAAVMENVAGGGTGRILLNSGATINFSSSSADAGTGVDTTATRSAAGVWNLTALGTTTDTRSGAGAVSVTTGTTKLTSTGPAEAITLANGVDGQYKSIIHDVDGGSMVLTPATKTGFSTITFTNVGESCLLQYVTTRGWIILSLNGAVAA